MRARQIGAVIDRFRTFPLRLSSIKGALTGTSRRGCRPTSTNLEVKAYNGRLPMVLPAHSRRRVGGIPLHMPNTVVDGCQRTIFIIQVTGYALKAGR